MSYAGECDGWGRVGGWVGGWDGKGGMTSHSPVEHCDTAFKNHLRNQMRHLLFWTHRQDGKIAWGLGGGTGEESRDHKRGHPRGHTNLKTIRQAELHDRNNYGRVGVCMATQARVR